MTLNKSPKLWGSCFINYSRKRLFQTSKMSSASKKSICLSKWKYDFRIPHRQGYFINTKQKGDFRFSQHGARVYNVLSTIWATSSQSSYCSQLSGSKQASSLVRNLQYSLFLVHYIHGKCIFTKNVKNALSLSPHLPPSKWILIRKKSWCKGKNLMLKMIAFLIILMITLSFF